MAAQKEDDLAAISACIAKMDCMRAAWPEDFRNRLGYATATQDLEAICRRIVAMPAMPVVTRKNRAEHFGLTSAANPRILR